jgi:antitoxin component HigA of HigAB toxin-antitoxin module
MDIKPIRAKRDYGAALKAVEKLMDAKRDIGRPNRVYEVLNRKRPLTLAMAWKLHTGLGIPAESLIRQAA